MPPTPAAPAALAALIRPDAVHRDLYTSPDLFALERRHFFANTWQYVVHASQLPAVGDYVTVDIAGRPLVAVRDADGAVRVLMNRCAHKGARVVSAPSGNTGAFFRCPYHAWAYDLDGALRAVPRRDGYAGTRMPTCEAGRGLVPVPHVRVYREFVFVKLSDHGPDFEAYFGEALTSIDNLVDRAPAGRLEITGGALRFMHDCNWKLFVENLNDTIHPMVVHESSAGTAKRLWSERPAAPGTPVPMAVEQFVPFVSGYEFFEATGLRVLPNGHSWSGAKGSIHSAYTAIPEYEAALVAAVGAERAHAILGTVRHNTVCYPSLTLKGAIQTIRVVRPIAVDRTLIESWTLRLVGAPDALLERSVTYNRLINAPFSVVGHDDLHVYRAIQQGLHADGNDWVSLHRDWTADETDPVDRTVGGLSELSMRNQYRAWLHFMTLSMAGGAP
ncbi:MAG: aromatic ring-hydroxylating dioxygenase subunit alpha [Burkholderiales bacterium]|nr:aromatic ring-hydroxylating dioxygenase subunit alpha [Burkholderiales bacterium]